MLIGPAKVASTESSALFAWAISAMASRSLMPVVGFPGVSTWISFVFGLIAFLTASVSVVSSRVTSILYFLGRYSLNSKFVAL